VSGDEKCAQNDLDPTHGGASMLQAKRQITTDGNILEDRVDLGDFQFFKYS